MAGGGGDRSLEAVSPAGQNVPATIFLDSEEHMARLIWSLQLLKSRWPDLHEIRGLWAVSPAGEVFEVVIRRGERRDDSVTPEYIDGALRITTALMGKA